MARNQNPEGNQSQPDGASNNSGTDPLPSMAEIELMLKNVLDDYESKLESVNLQHRLSITDNTKAISEINDLVMDLSLQIIQMNSDKSRSDPSALQLGENMQGNASKDLVGCNLGNKRGIEGKTGFQYSTRLTKVEIPKFNGEGIKSWLYRVEQFFLVDRIEEHNKVRLASIHLEGNAL